MSKSSQDVDTSGTEDAESGSKGSTRRGVLKGALFVGATVPLIASQERPQVDSRIGLGGSRPLELISFNLNGEQRHAAVEHRTSLLDVLRRQLNVTGPKKGCGRSGCGFCTVLLNGESIYACTKLAKEVDGEEVLTVEGIGTPDDRHPIQEGFIAEKGMQCGFCTPGQIMSAYAVLKDNPDPSREEIKGAADGVLCRCSTYGTIWNSIEWAADEL